MRKLYKTKLMPAGRSLIVLCLLFVGTTSTTYAQCDTPANLAANNVMGGNADLSWDAVVGAESYEVRYRVYGDPNADPNFTFQAAAGTATTLTGLTDGVVYSAQVRTICSSASGLQSFWSSGVIFSSFGGATCVIPTNLTFSNVLPTQADFDWDAVSGALSYNIRYKVVGTAIFTTLNVASNSTTITGLNPSSRYQVQVQAVCAIDGSLISAFSQGVIFRSASCITPTNLSVALDMGTSVSLVWDAPIDALSYEVRFAEVGTMVYTTVNSATNSVTLVGLDENLRYQAQVRSFCTADLLNFSFFSEGVTFGPIVCDPPVNLAATNTTSDQTDITWDAVDGALSYVVRYRADGAGAFTEVATATNTVNITGLAAETEYQVQVRSICKADISVFSVFSAGLLFTTDAAPSANFVMKSFPNPFFSQTIISLQNASSNFATLAIYNLDGVMVHDVYQGELDATRNYDFEISGSGLQKGMYFYKLTTQEGDVYMNRMVLSR